MDATLLATKLQIPPLPHQTVHRGRLVELLDHGVPKSKLVVVSAPAGYGKSILLAQWAQATSVGVAWLSLDAADDSPERFFRYLLTAWERVRPGVRESLLGLRLGATEPDLDAVLAAFVNLANSLPGHTAFVLDDAHLIADPAVHTALTFLLDHLPPTLHLVVAGRARPPLPLARYRARQELLEIGAEDLHFLEHETAEYLNELLHLDLAPAEIGSLHAQLDGWIAGLQLVALTLRHHRAVDPLLVSGRHRFIADYLSEDVVARVSDPMRQFLLRTSILDRLCGALCDAVTGGTDGEAMLEQLERENLFLAPLDDQREWFRYHRLFADYLRRELIHRHHDEVAALHRRAGGWYLEQDLPEPALHHAIAGDDPELVMHILDRYESIKLHGGELGVFQDWLDAIPPAWYAANPLFELYRAGILLFTGALDACAHCIDGVEQRLLGTPTEPARVHLARITAVRCFLACFRGDLDRAELYADRALRELREEDVAFRADIHHALGDTYRGHGRWLQAREHYLRVLEFADLPGARVRSVHVLGALADLDLRQGRLRDAEAYWRKALAAIDEPASWGRLPQPVIGWVFLRLGEILYERNELPAAWDALTRGLQRAELGGDVRGMIAGYVLTSRVKLTEGDVEAAAISLERARPLVAEATFPDWTGRFERCQIEVWLTQSRLRATVDWADAVLQSEGREGRPEREIAGLALARVLIVKGDAPSRERALDLIRRLLQTAEAEGRMGLQIEALALRALAEWQSGERAGALVSLEHALRLAEPEGYVRLFADLGLPMTRLLQEARSRKVMPEYAATLLAACGAGFGSADTGGGSPPEPLSQREQDVLRLLAAGLTNREIAETLFISPETVKKHTGNVYAKLGVSRRTEAVARAREWDLLADSP